MFKLQPAPTFQAPVKLTVPGQTEPAEITVTFRHLGKDGYRAFLADAMGTEEKPAAPDAELLPRIVAGWDGVDEPYSDDNLKVLLNNYPASALELLTVYRKQAMESREKN